MAKIIGRNASLYIEASALGASISLSGQSNNITLGFTTDEVETTGFGNNFTETLANGVEDWTLTFNAFWSGGVAEIDQTLFGILITGCTRIRFGPAGSAACSIKYEACGILSEYEVDFESRNAGRISGTVVARSGSMTRDTW